MLYVKTANPLTKSHPLFPSNLPFKIEILTSPLLFENLVRGSTPPAERGDAHYVTRTHTHLLKMTPVVFHMPKTLYGVPGFELAISKSQFAKRFASFRMGFCIFSKNYELLNQIFRVIH